MKAWLSIAVVLVACGKDGSAPPAKKEKTADEVKQEWSARIKSKLEKVVAAARAAKGAELGAPGDATRALDFNWGKDAHPNAIAVQIDDVRSATAPRAKATSADDPLAKAAALTRQHPRFSFQEDNADPVYEAKQLLGIEDSQVLPEFVYDQFVGAKYILVVTPGDVTWPEEDGSTFKPGNAPLRAILVDIDSAKPLGGFDAVGRSSDKVLVEEKSLVEPGNSAELAKKLDQDFMEQAGHAIVKGIEQRWPGAKTPLDFGFRSW